jgi:hypothetical protein
MARAFCAPVAVAVAALLCGPVSAHAGQRGGARTSVNRSASANVNRSANVDRSANVNQNANVNRNVNVNSNTDVNRNVDVNRNYNVDVDRGGWGGCCYHSGVGVAAAVATTAAATAAVVGTRVQTLPPSCTAIVAGGVTYQQCGSVWYQPQFVGTGTTYVVVNAPY